MLGEQGLQEIVAQAGFGGAAWTRRAPDMPAVIGDCGRPVLFRREIRGDGGFHGAASA
jgi:hypothetical protein